MSRLALFLVLLLGVLVQSCTYRNQPTRVLVSREADTLRVMLDPIGSARWSPTRDSLIILCESCELGPRITERFESGRIARFEVSRYDSLQWRVLGSPLRDSLVVIENYDLSDSAFTGKDRPRVTKRRIKTMPQRKLAEHPETSDTKKKATAPTVKRAKSLRVSANEGVAVYKDKSKREVLKILPKGAQLPLLSREGDVYSVSVDGAEGFVESEAVEVE
jgi:hypothetical protein